MLDIFTAVTRAVHYGSGILAWAAIAFPLIYLPSTARGNSGILSNIVRSLDRRALLALLVHIVSGVAWIWCVAKNLSNSDAGGADSLPIMMQVFTGTVFGKVNIFRLTISVIIAALIIRKRSQPISRQGATVLALVLVTILLGSLGIIGHSAAMAHGNRSLMTVIGVGHLLAAGIWPGSLVPLSILLRHCLTGREPKLVALTMFTVKRFSLVSLITVCVVLGSGLSQAATLVGSVKAMGTTDYGEILSCKLLVLLGVLGIAGSNHFQLVPALSGATTTAKTIKLLGTLYQRVILEIILVGIIILIVGFLGMTPPVQSCCR